MAKRKIVWTDKANIERKEILEYWINKNKSKTYSIKLNKLLIESLKLISEYPKIGRQNNEENTRAVSFVIIYYFMKSMKKKSLFSLFGTEDEMKMN